MACAVDCWHILSARPDMQCHKSRTRECWRCVRPRWAAVESEGEVSEQCPKCYREMEPVLTCGFCGHREWSPVGKETPLLACYNRFQHLDRVFEMVRDSDGTEQTDPFHAAARDMWRAIKAAVGKEKT